MHTDIPGRRHFIQAALAVGASLSVLGRARAASAPVRIGLDCGPRDSARRADEAIRAGLDFAIADINAAGGVLGGRPVELVLRDGDHAGGFAALKDMVGVFVGGPGPLAPAGDADRILTFDPLSATDVFADDGAGNVFRLSLNDRWAMRTMAHHLAEKQARRIGVLVPDSAWGRSCVAATGALVERSGQTLAGVEWYRDGGTPSLAGHYVRLRRAGMDGLLMIGDQRDGARLIDALVTMPARERVPVASHWGASGGDLPRRVGSAVRELDFSVVQTFSFESPRNPQTQALAQRAMARFGSDDAARIPSAGSLAHTYDLMQLVGWAINIAGSTEAAAVRKALENLPPVEGVIRRYAPAFSAACHEALRPDELFMSRFTTDGRLARVMPSRA